MRRAIGFALQGAVTSRDIRERLVPLLVQPRVQEPELRAMSRLQTIVEQRDDARHRRARCASAENGVEGIPRVDDELVRLRGDVRERAPGCVICALVILAVSFQVRRDSCILICRARVIVGESTRRARPGFFGGVALGATNRSYAGYAT